MLPKKKYKSSKVKSFFLFLLLAILFWALTKFSREYTATINASVHYKNIPKNTILGEENPKELSFDVTANGFEFLMYKLKEPSVKIDVNSFYNEEVGRANVSKSDLVKLITNQLKKNISVRNLSINELTVALNEIVSRTIPVRANANITFKEGFNSIDSLKIIPDSVSVSGPASDVKEISFVETSPVNVENADGAISINAPLELSNNEKVSFSPREVQLQLEVVEFSQKEMLLPIEVMNLPENTTIKLIPEMVKVVFSISVNDFKTISKDDFQLICDYAVRNTEENFMVPKFLKKPKSVLNIELSDKKIDYLIFK